jgi:hypothetical protein
MTPEGTKKFLVLTRVGGERMKRIITMIAILAAFSLFGISGAGQSKPRGFDSKHLEIHYDKFRDQTVVRTKSMNIAFQVGKKVYFCSMVVGYSVRKGQKSSLAILFAPGASGFVKRLNASLDPDFSRAFFSHNADVIVLVGDNRYPLSRFDGAYFAPNGDTIVAAEIPAEVVEAISKAEKWDVAVGSLEARFVNKSPFIAKGAINHSDGDKFRAITAQYAGNIQTPSK